METPRAVPVSSHHRDRARPSTRPRHAEGVRHRFRCEECGQSFSLPENLSRHVKSKHRSPAKPCEWCGRSFNRSDTLIRHIKTLHAKESELDQKASGPHKRRRNNASPQPSSLSVKGYTMAPSGYVSSPEPESVETVPSRANSAPALDATAGQQMPMYQARQQPEIYQAPLPAQLYQAGDWALDWMVSSLWNNPGAWMVDEAPPPAPVELDALLRGNTTGVITSAESVPQASPALTGLVEQKYGDVVRLLCELKCSKTSLLTKSQCDRRIDLYFKRFQPLWPLLHVPTFDLSEAPTILVAAIIAIGGCYIESAPQLQSSVVHLTQILLIEAEKAANESGRIADLQACLILTVAAFVTGNQSIYQQAQHARISLMQLCRDKNLLNSLATFSVLEKNSDQDPKSRWLRWIEAERQKRLGLSISLVDNILPCLLDVPAYHSNQELSSSLLPCDEPLWAAADANTWLALLDGERLPVSRRFSQVIMGHLTKSFPDSTDILNDKDILNPFSALLTFFAFQQQGLSFRNQLSMFLSLDGGKSRDDLPKGYKEQRQRAITALDSFKTRHLPEGIQGEPLYDIALAMYHLGHLALHTTLSDLQALTGRRGPEAAKEVAPLIQLWASSADGPVAVEHAVHILAVLSESHAAHDAVYFPLLVFVATSTVWAFAACLSDAASDVLHQWGSILGLEWAMSLHAILQHSIDELQRSKAWSVSVSLEARLRHLLDKQAIDYEASAMQVF